MNPDKQRIAIAKACGWQYQIPPAKLGFGQNAFWIRGTEICDLEDTPDYLNDLNAMHEAEKTMDAVRRVQYSNELRKIIIHRSSVVSCDEYELIHAPAAQRAETFLRTVGRWETD